MEQSMSPVKRSSSLSDVGARATSGLPTYALDYIFRMMPKIKRYLTVVDALAIAIILVGQRDAKLRGGIAEIGVFFGRSFYLMAMLIDKHEKALAIDLFDIGASQGRDSWQLTCFLDVGRRLNINIDREMVIVGKSQELDAPAILEKTGPLRFCSVDDGHKHQDVFSDATLAGNVISDCGVICFDDFCYVEWPEVTFGIYDFLRTNAATFVPFLISQNKLFVCKREYHNLYTTLIGDSEPLRKIRKKSRNRWPQ